VPLRTPRKEHSILEIASVMATTLT
jgi:hypothetical protein